MFKYFLKALFTSIYQDNTDIALCLIKNGASLVFEDKKKENFTLLHYACYLGLLNLSYYSLISFIILLK